MSYIEESPRSGNNRVLIIVIVIAGVVLLLAGVCGGLIYYSVKTFSDAVKPMAEMMEDMQRGPAVADNFLADIRANRLQAAYVSTTEAFQARMTLDEFEKLIKTHSTLQQPAQFLGVDANQPGGQPQPFPNLYRFRYEAQAKEGKDRIEFTITVAKEQGSLKVDQFQVFQAVNPK